ncbi:Dihydrodipicolinate synthase/N-acetylneuraminate lyase [Pyrobaculum oguniense TE7]|uniref:Dihydrodipicolinate synthase/N-acetylneuraminate lyase n=1 Tax=Pyrobaculum oguniense (strain DSM 13380 / JCM 10595 / TE7) TaxID=698757 RepID=H6Q9L8_PYROT|nr:Dihydrodipicolinate synthase/N-acetylneuraminate lyase [Pyrobaculum oguniense TE7]
MDIIAPIITPFRSGKVDVETFINHAKNIMKKGVDALFVAGTTGLGPALSLEERKALLEAASSVTRRVIMQVGFLNLYDVLALVKYAEKFDIEAVASVPPYYFPGLSQRQVAKYFRELCAATSLPVYLYNYPAAVGRNVDAEMAKAIGCLKGVKDTNPDLAHTLAYKRLMPEIKAYKGSDSLVMAFFAVGLDGVIVASANYIPDVLVKIRDAVLRRDVEKAKRLQFLINEILEVATPLGYNSSVYELVRIFQGYDPGEPRPPIYPLESEEREKLAKAVSRIKEALNKL